MTAISSFFPIQKKGSSWDAVGNDASAATPAEEGTRRGLEGLKEENLKREDKLFQKSRLEDVLSKRRTNLFNGDESSVALSVASSESTRAQLEAKLAERNAARRRCRSKEDSPTVRVPRSNRIRRTPSGEMGGGSAMLRRTLTSNSVASTGAPQLRRTLSNDIGLSAQTAGIRRGGVPQLRRALSNDIGSSTQTATIRRGLTRTQTRTSRSPCRRPLRQKSQQNLVANSPNTGSASPTASQVNARRNLGSASLSSKRPAREDSKRSVVSGTSTTSASNRRPSLQKSLSRPKLFVSKSASSIERGAGVLATGESTKNSSWEAFTDKAGFDVVIDKANEAQSTTLPPAFPTKTETRSAPSFLNDISCPWNEHDEDGLFKDFSESDFGLGSNEEPSLSMDHTATKKTGNKTGRTLAQRLSDTSLPSDHGISHVFERQDVRNEEQPNAPQRVSSNRSLAKLSGSGDRRKDSPRASQDTREPKSLADVLEKRSKRSGKSSGRSVSSKLSASKSLGDVSGSRRRLKKKSSERSVGSSASKLSSSSSHSLHKLKLLKARHQELQQQAEESIKKMRSTPSLGRISKGRSVVYDPYQQDIDESPSVRSRRNGTFSSKAARSSDRWLVSKSGKKCLSSVSSMDGDAKGKGASKTLDRRLQDLQSKWNADRECLIVGEPHLIGVPSVPQRTGKTVPPAG